MAGRKQQLIDELARLHRQLSRRSALQDPRRGNVSTTTSIWQTIFDAITDGVCLLDHDQNIILYNKVFGTLVSKDEHAIIGRHCWEVVHGSKEPLPECPVVSTKKSLQRSSIKLPLKDRMFEIAVDPILDEHGAYAGAVHIMRDITGRTQAEHLIHETNVKLTSREQELTAVNEKLMESFLQAEARETALRESEFLFRSQFEFGNIGIAITSVEKNWLRVNKRLCEMLGYSEEELLQKRWDEMTFPDDLAYDLSRFNRLVAGEIDVYEMDKRFVRKDGSTVYTHLNVSCYRNLNRSVQFVIASLLDITERKQAQNEIEKSKGYLENIFKISPDIIMATDADGIIISVNAVVEKILGYTPDELIGQHSSILRPDEEHYRKSVSDMISSLFEQGVIINYEFYWRTKQGSPHPLECSSILLKNDAGDVSGAVSFIRDIAERKRLEQQLRQAQKMEAIGTLAGGIAHDFNNILAAIIGYTELAQRKIPHDSAVTNLLGNVLQAADRARNLVQQILAFSRKTEQEQRPVAPHLIIKEALKLLRASIPSTIAIKHELNEQSGMIFADPTQIHQVLMNLCTNAAHAMEEKGGVLTIQLSPVSLTPEDSLRYPDMPPGPYIRLTVRDTGIGIDPGIRERIFDPFFTTKKVGKGTGMGLSVVHGIVKTCGGAISLESKPGEGSTFHVLLPRISEQSAEKTEREVSLPLGTERILFADDEESLVYLGERLLASLGYTVIVCRNGREALQTFARAPESFDLIITDQTMPGMTGYELAKKIMAIRSDIPIILCTGYSESISEEKTREVGIKAFVMKPLTLKNIAETVRIVLDGR